MLSFEHPVVAFLAFGTLLTEISVLIYLGVKIFDRSLYLPFSDGIESFDGFLRDRFREIGFFFAAAATAGSLYLSNFINWEPCRLCWFQRIFMYPLVILFAVSLIFDREDVAEYVMPLSLAGLGTAVYHYIFQFLPEIQSSGCSVTSVSCEATYTFYFGHISIPTMAAAAFLAITAVSYRAYMEV